MISRTRTPRPRLAWLAALMVGLLVLAACETDDDAPADDVTEDDDDVVDEDEDVTEDEDVEDDPGEAVGEGETITIGWIPWEEAIAVTNLWHVVLEENGYEVEQQQLDPGLLFDGVATGELDLFLDAWLPNTHSSYWDEYGDEVTDLGIWLDEAPLTWTVPAYVDEVDSIADLDEHGDLFDHQIVGIEAGAGLTDISLNEVIPAYGLDDWELIESSTPAMLSELETAIANEEPIVVTLWRPHPAYANWDLKDLEDPEGALGEADSIHAIARPDFGDDHPQLQEAFENWYFEHEDLSELAVAVLEDVEEGEELEGARTWLDENRDVVNEWLEGTDLSV